MSTAFWILVAIVAVVAAVVVTFVVSQDMQRRRLREHFGPEYDRAVAEDGDRRSAERRLTAVAKRRASLDIRPLSERDRRSLTARWNQIQSDFVDQPVDATDRAGKLIVEIMRARGYPVEDFETRAGLLAFDDPQVVANYREADSLWRRNKELDAADTEELRTALVRYRALFQRLLKDHVTEDPGYVDLGTARAPGRASPGPREEKSSARSAVLPAGSTRRRTAPPHQD